MTMKNQRGLTLLEVIISLGIIALGSVGVAQMTDMYSTDVKNAVAADHLRKFGDATRAYINDNYTTISATATATAPVLVTSAMLVAGGYLPTGSSVSNGYNQNTCSLVLQPSANKLQGLVVTEAGTTIDDLSVGTIASLAGGSAASITTTNATNIVGTMGGWTIPVATYHNRVNNLSQKCDGTSGNVQITAGHLAYSLWFENGNFQSSTLYRDAIPGRPELNTMNTPILMSTSQTVGNACTTGQIGRDSTGAIMNCVGSLWAAVGGGASNTCESTAADLNNLQDDKTCWNSAGNANSPAGADYFYLSVKRHTNATNYYVEQVLSGMNGASYGKVWRRVQNSATQAGGWTAWTQIADSSVSIMPNTISSTGAAGSYGAITIQGSKNGYSGIEFRDSAGTYKSVLLTEPSATGIYDEVAGRWRFRTDTSGTLTLDQTADWASGHINPGWAVETQACATGKIAKAAYTVTDGWAYNGKTLSCVNGVWAVSGGSGSGRSAIMAPLKGREITYIVPGPSWRTWDGDEVRVKVDSAGEISVYLRPYYWYVYCATPISWVNANFGTVIGGCAGYPYPYSVSVNLFGFTYTGSLALGGSSVFVPWPLN